MKSWSSFLGTMLVVASAAALSPTTDPSRVQLSDPTKRDLGGSAERRLSELEREAQTGKLELEALSKEDAAAHARIVSRGRVYVRLAKAGLLPVGGGFDAFVEHAVHLERLRSAIGRDVALERDLSARRVALGRKLSDLETRRSTLQNELQAMRVAQTALLSEQDRADAFARAFSSSVGSAHTAVYGAGVGPGDPASPSGGFASLKGRLPFPITGRSEIRSARRPGSEGPGLEMFAPSGSVVRAVHAGRVAFADEYAAYGRTVILDHGGGYYTVSANLGTIEVKVGDDVPFGSRIATVGGSDAGGAARLYFEIRVGTTTVSPAEWFGI
jgi:murein DD-endopeptidase MepM/ murein hydrolase activator NlpD